MARKKVKIGDTVSFNFAGQPLMGVLENIEEMSWGTVTNTWYKVKHEDGTIYPCRKEALTLVNG
jgi:predicted lysophospholipase L1 biosynthesis ABC-type transport system permease subunit